MLQAACTIPRPLVICIEAIPCCIKTNASRRADTATCRGESSIGINANTPTTILAIAAKRTCQAKHNPNITILVELGAESIFMVIAIDFPSIGNGLKDVRFAIAVRIFKFRKFASLCGIDPTILGG